MASLFRSSVDDVHHRSGISFDRLLAIADKLAATGVEPMTAEEINAEIKAAHAERRARADRP